MDLYSLKVLYRKEKVPSVLYAVCQISHCTHQVRKLESPEKIQLGIKGTVSQNKNFDTILLGNILKY